MSNNVTTLDSQQPKAKTKAAEQAQVLKANSGSADFCGRRAKIFIAVSDQEGGKNPVFVGVAGTGFLIPRGKHWDVPVEVANVLRDANVTTWQRDEADKNWERMESPRFSFTAVDLDPAPQPAPQAEQAAA